MGRRRLGRPAAGWRRETPVCSARVSKQCLVSGESSKQKFPCVLIPQPWCHVSDRISFKEPRADAAHLDLCSHSGNDRSLAPSGNNHDTTTFECKTPQSRILIQLALYGLWCTKFITVEHTSCYRMNVIFYWLNINAHSAAWVQNL